MTLYQVCEATARAGRADGDGRSLEQLRADALVGLAERAFSEGCVLPASDASSAPSQFAVGYRFSGRTAQVHITIPEALLTPAKTAETRITAAGVFAAEIAGDEDFLDRADAQGYAPPASCTPGVDVPDLAGYGAIAPATVRNLLSKYGATSDSTAATSPTGKLPTWLKINPPVDPDDPPPDAPGYRPTAELDRYVRRRDQHCRAPSCTVLAASGDVDHITPWPMGRTSAPNLHALCRRHHLQKTHGGHSVTKNPDGSITWTTRAGQRLTQYLDGRITRTRAP